ncbi:MAG: acyl-CoA carboxylase subunit beta [Micropepsaceae bacterium]
MSWENDVEELRRRQRLAQEMGGEERVAKHRSLGKLTVRERVDALLDPGSFHEVGSTTGAAVYGPDGEMVSFTPVPFIFGRGLIDGRPVVVAGDDFTVRGGSADFAGKRKQEVAEQMARELRLPIIRLIDGSGGGGSVKTYEQSGFTYVPANPAWDDVVANLATVPVVSLVLGSVAGLGAARAVTSHYSMIVKGTAQMFIAGPPVVKQIGQDLTKEELGGSAIHTKNGAIDDEVESEAEGFARARRFLSYLPSSVFDVPPRGPQTDDPARREEMLIRVVPRSRRQVYKMRTIVEAVFDRDSFFEIGRGHGRSSITGLARLDGWPVAVLASDPFVYGGAWTAESSLKVTRFVDFAETFHLPVVHLVDIPGFRIGLESEQAATIRHGARAMTAIYQASGPWCTILIRKAFGVAGAAMSNATRLPFRYAWPSGDWGSLPLEGGIEAAYRRDLEAAEDPAKLRAEIDERLNRVRSPFRTAEKFGIEEIIDPRDTRKVLCAFANLAAPLRAPGMRATAYRP